MAHKVSWKQEKMLYAVIPDTYTNFSVSKDKLLKQQRCLNAPGNQRIIKDAK